MVSIPWYNRALNARYGISAGDGTVLGVLPEVFADRLLQGKAIHHLELAGPPSRRVMFSKGNRRRERERWGPAG